ncbi:MAG: AAA family ATPase [Planctomycetes bacterium]|nr:AAA family ATPase [Planctomycetota bacterium]
MSSVPPPDESGLVGTVVRDRYEVLRLLGQGGMGAVYAVHDRQSGAERALKVLSSSQGGMRVAQHRFKREFSTISRVSHPGIVTVYDFGELGGVLFYVMEMLTSSSMADLVPKPPDLPDRAGIAKRLRVMIEVIEALGYVHQHHLIHRDLKPSNLIFGDDGKPRITDFGLAKDFDNAITLTESGAILGTLSHMAPEQLQGRKIDHRADLYAIGIMLYQMATGRLPFTETNPLALMRQQVTQAPIAPSKHNPACPRELDDVIVKLLARDPVDRYSNAGSLISDLNAVIQGQTPGATKLASESKELRTTIATAAGYVGRQEELQKMQTVLEQAGAGEGGTAVIVGEAGIGKTRFVEEFCARALLYGVTFLKGRADRRAGVFYRPFIEMIEAYSGRIGQYDNETEAAMFEGIGRVLARLVPRLLERKCIAEAPEPPALDPGENKVRLFDAVTRFFLRISQNETLVLFFDDFHQVDELSLELFQYLGRNARTARLMLVAACRGEDLASRGGKANPVDTMLQALRRENVKCETITLKRLTEAETARLARALAPDVELSTEFVGRLQGRTAGVPYFVEELLRWLKEQGALQKGHWPEEVPETVEAVLRERLEGIDEKVLGALRAAAVVGEEFEFEVLMRATGEDEGALLEAIDNGVRAKVLKERPGERYAFVHPLLRMMLYSKMLPRRRKLLHQSIAKALEERGGDTGTREAAEALAYHWTNAGDREKATAYSIEAARKAFGAFANEAARAHAEAAIRGLEEKNDPAAMQKMYDTLDLLFDILMVSGSSTDATAAANRMVLLAGQLVDPERRARANFKLAKAQQQAGKYQATIAHLKETLNETQSPALRVMAMGILGFTMAEKLGNPQEGLKISEEAVRLSEGLTDASARYAALNGLGVALLRAGQVAQAAAQMRRTVEFAREKGLRIAECNGLNNLSVALEEQGRTEERLVTLKEALDRARQIGYVSGECLYLVGLAAGLNDAESPDAEPLARQARELSKRAGFRTSYQSACNLLANIAFKHAEFAEVRKLLAETLADPECNIGVLTGARTLDTEAAIRLGQAEEGLQALQATAERIKDLPVSTWVAGFQIDRAALLIQAGHLVDPKYFDQAAVVLASLAGPLAAIDVPGLANAYRFQQGRLAAIRGEAERSEEHFRACMPFLLSQPSQSGRASTRAWLAISQEKLGRIPQARELWLRAEEDMLRIGLQPFWQSFLRLFPKMASLAASEVSEARTEVRPAPPSGLLLDVPPFVGREAEMEWLLGRLKEILEKKAGGLVVYRGPTGIGKTRLLREFGALAAREGVPVLTGIAREESKAVAHGPWVAVARQVLEALPEKLVAPDLAAALRAGVPELAEHPLLMRVAPGDARTSRGELSPEQERLRVHDALARLIEAAASGATGSRAGLVLMLDDAGSADESSLDLMAYLARSLRRHPVLFIANYNAEDVSDAHPLARRLAALSRDREVTARELEPLRSADITKLVEALVGLRRDAAELVQVVSEKSGGNPLFARELLLAMFRGGHVEEKEESYRLKTRSIRLPDTIAGLLRSQLEGLNPDVLRVLSGASVIGREFDFETLMDISSADEKQLVDWLEGLVKVGILETVPDDPMGRDLYRFQAPQMREVIYAGISRAERETMHRRAAEALERLSLARKGVSTGELAHHFVLGGGGRKARDYSLEAGIKAAKVCANGEAKTHLENALRIMKADKAVFDRGKAFEALNELALVQMRVGENLEARRLCDEAISVAETPVQRAKVGRGLAQAMHRAGDLKEAAKIGEEALRRLAKDLGGPDARDFRESLPPAADIPQDAAEQAAALLGMLVFEHNYLGNRDLSRDLCTMGRRYAERTQKPESIAGALKTEAFVLQDDGRHAEARAAYDQALRLQKAQGNRWAEAALLNNIAGLDTATGNVRGGLERYIVSARLFADVGDLVEHGRQLTNIGRAQLDLGEWKDAEITLVQALDLNVRLREKRSMCFVHSDLARLYLDRDEREKAKGHAQEALKLADELGFVGLQLGAHHLLHAIARRGGNYAGAREIGRRALDIAREKRLPGSIALAAFDAMEAEAAAGDVAEAGRLLDEARTAAGPEPGPALSRAEGVLAEAKGDFRAAAQAFSRQLAAVEKGENPFATAAARLDLGRALAAQVKREGPARAMESRAALEAALPVFGKLGAKWYEAQARSLVSGLPA